MNHYIAYNAHLDEFVKIKKLSNEELVSFVGSCSEFLSNEPGGISKYLRHTVENLILTSDKYNFDECLESLFECVIEVYPLLQIELVCRAINDSLEDVVVSNPKKTLDDINNIKKRILKRLIGQETAVSKSLDAVKLISSGLEGYVSLFFIGPTGVGKTELSKLLAEEYLGSSKKLLKINCGEYSNSHEYSKLIGSPPGYIGHNEKGILSERASESSEWIICFDEVEKAHDKLIDLLLNLLDEGKLTDSRGVELDFSKSVFVFTSNIGLKGTVGRKKTGFNAVPVSYSEAIEEITEQFESKFSPEFRNRLDSVVYFNQLKRDDVCKIVENRLSKLPIKKSKRLINYVVDESFSPQFGARNVNRYIKNNITVRIAEKLLEGNEKGPFKIKINKGKEVSLEGLLDI